MDTPADIHRVIDGLWIVMLIVWVAAGLGGKQTVRQQSAGSRLLHLSLAGLAYAFLFTGAFQRGPLASNFVPRIPLSADVGLVLTACGIGFAIWARLFLGGNWSGSVTVKQHHSLVLSGPYALVRHPIYSGILLATLGTAIAFREVKGLVGFALAVLIFRLKSRLEESFMIGQFGGESLEYQRQVKALIPFVW